MQVAGVDRAGNRPMNLAPPFGETRVRSCGVRSCVRTEWALYDWREGEAADPWNSWTRMTVLIDGEPWFVARDVCEVLGLEEAHVAVRSLDDDEKGRCIIPTPGGTQQMTVISEAGLYSLTIRSRKPSARQGSQRM